MNMNNKTVLVDSLGCWKEFVKIQLSDDGQKIYLELTRSWYVDGELDYSEPIEDYAALDKKAAQNLIKALEEFVESVAD